MGPGPDEPDDSAAEQGPDAAAGDTTPTPTDDERWAAIIADLADIDEADGADPAVTYPVAPWVSDPRVAPAAAPEAPDELAVGGRDWDGTGQLDAAEAAVDADEHFVPPDPGPVLGGDPLLTMAWLAAGGMPVFLLVVVLAWPHPPATLIQAAAGVFVLGVVALVWRMPHRRDDADDDTGAVV